MAAAPLAVKKPEVKRVKNPLFVARPRNFEIGQSIQPKVDLSRFVKWSKRQKQNKMFLKRKGRDYNTNDINEFKEAWRCVVAKAGLENIRELAMAVKHFLSIHPSKCKIEEGECKHRTVSYSPLHLAVESGQLSLCIFILGRIKDKNPAAKGDEGWTPLHEAAQSGFLEICNQLMSNVENENPQDYYGWIPFHAAAFFGHFEVCEAIMKTI